MSASGGRRHGLVVIDRLEHTHLGMNRSLLAARGPLASAGVTFEVGSVRTPYHLARALLKGRGRRPFDFLLFNSLGALLAESRLGHRLNGARPLWMLARRLGVPTVLYWHETDWVLDRVATERPGDLARIRPIAADPATTHLTASSAGLQSIRRRFPASDPFVIYECVPQPVGERGVPTDPPLVVNLASIQPRKGTDLFVRSAIALCRRHPTVTFAWLGGGTPFGTWKEEIASEGLDERIHFPGYVSDPAAWLARSSALFLSSRDDPCPLAVLEAMAHARHVVAFNVGGAPEVLAGRGTVVSPFDTEAAAAALEAVIRRPAAARPVPAARERYAQQFTPEAFAARLVSCLDSALG